MENDQVRRTSKYDHRGWPIYASFFKGLLVDLYVPRKCAATSEYSASLENVDATQMLTNHLDIKTASSPQKTTHQCRS
jgi:hypothetical protein